MLLTLFLFCAGRNSYSCSHSYTHIQHVLSKMNFFTILHFLKQAHVTAILSWLQGDNTCCDRMVSVLNLTPHNNNYPRSNFNTFRVVSWPRSDHTTIWSISQCAWFEIWQICPLCSNQGHTIQCVLLVGHAFKPISPLTRANLNFWIQWFGLSFLNTMN